MIQKILVANRGEIAIRIMKTARKLGVKSVAVYSDVDRNAPHVLYADEAVGLGGVASSESYLRGDKIIQAAVELEADAIHPGYGFLSENADFARQVEKAGLVFIGPTSEAIEIMGSKLAAKAAVKGYDIPMVPGTDEAIGDPEKALSIAEEIGFPILIKASAGGGGKGMRIVNEKSALEQQMKRAISEAESAFGDGAVFIEKYIGSPRHIEIQVLADTHGNTIHLFERECSIQRRHQKVIEEAPSAVVDPDLRMKMGATAVQVAEACNYRGAGTVEFLMDEHKNFYFLEMNTRLQVEHPVTEWVTGVDLVEQQIRIAQGEPLEFRQEDVDISGHALELRVYAENPLEDFLPSVGTLDVYQLPSGPDIRVDNGMKQGMDVSIHYDPMLAKLITYGPTRQASIGRMLEAIDQYKVEGIQTTLSFGKFVCLHPAFRSGKFDTHFVRDHYDPEKLRRARESEARIAGLFALKHYLEESRQLRLPNN